MQNPAERHNFILNQLRSQGYVTVTDLSDELDVSEVTIRKDLRTLEERNLLFRTRGGANPILPHSLEHALEEKAALHADRKDRIGRLAATLVEPGDSILLASGSTVMYVARHLDDIAGLMAVTNAINVALALAPLPGVEVLVLGGLLRPNAVSMVGPYAEQMLREHACSKLFLGVDGFDLDHGPTTANALEAHLNQSMIQAAERVIVVTDASKFGRRGFRRICCIEDVDVVVTDDEAPDAVVERLENMGVEVLIAG